MCQTVVKCLAEIRADTEKRKTMAQTNEIRILRMIKGNTLWDQRTSKEIREECKTEDVVGHALGDVTETSTFPGWRTTDWQSQK